MKKVILSIALAMMSVSAMFAQSEEFKYGLGNRIGIGVGAGTEGIGVDVSTCFNKQIFWCKSRFELYARY